MGTLLFWLIVTGIQLLVALGLARLVLSGIFMSARPRLATTKTGESREVT